MFFYDIALNDLERGLKYNGIEHAISLNMNDKKNHSPELAGFERHVVLMAPEVHWNTGNIGRTCLGAGAFLHLVKPLGFSLGSKEVKRAGLDYWPRVKLSVWEDYTSFLSAMDPQPGEMVFFSKTGRRSVFDLPCEKRLFLVFGSETRGLPQDLLDEQAGHLCSIPITSDIRSLNLSTAVGIALYQSLAGTGFENHWGV